MTGHFQEQLFTKDDEASISSSMDDSTYMSMPDTNQRAAGVGESSYGQNPRESRGQMDSFLNSNIYSPALSSESQLGYQGPQAEMSQMFLPPSAGEADGSELTNHTAGQVYGRYSFDYQSHINQDQWAANDVQMYSCPFAVGPTEAPSYYVPHNQQSPIDQPFVIPSWTASRYTARSTNVQAAQTPRRPSLSRMSRSVTSTSELNSSNAMSSTPQEQTARPSSRTSSGMAQSNAFHPSVLMSRTTSVASQPHTKVESIAEESHHYMDVSLENAMEQSTSGSVIFSANKEDEFEEESFHMAQTANAQASVEEAESKLARTHPLYNATPGADDLYHCPHEGQAGCTHKPTKLKCNYDKYVDSHLRPFRCKVPSCNGVQFSSTACRLRHEREAHGMHGHGSKPHLCTFQDCDRSIPGNGFPRRYNLFDHMKRVHDYTGSTSPIETESPRLGQATLKRQVGRKRKSAASDEPSEKRAKTSKAASAAAALRNAKLQETRQLQQEWEQQKALLHQRIESLQNPRDLTSHVEVSEELVKLQKICQRLTELG